MTAHSMDRLVASPDGEHRAEFTYVTEIRFGPPYFTLAIDGRPLQNRVFGDQCVWSPDSRYVAVQEWDTTKEAEGPQTALVVFDVGQWRESRLAEATKGFVEPRRFDGDLLAYAEEYYADRIRAERAARLPPPERWRSVAAGARRR